MTLRDALFALLRYIMRAIEGALTLNVYLAVLVLFMFAFIRDLISRGIFVVALGLSTSIIISAITVRFCTRRQRLAVRALALPLFFQSVIVFFGMIYYAVYLNDPNSFAISSDIRQARSSQQFDDTYQRIKANQEKLLAVEMIRTYPSAAAAAANKLSLDGSSFGSSEGVSVHHFDYNFARGGFSSTLIVRFGAHEVTIGGRHPDIGEEAEFVRGFRYASTTEAVTRACDTLSEFLRGERRALVAQLDTLAQQNPTLDWFDFVYFSTVTTTTVGYGDIYPMKALPRMLVMLQAIVGFLVLGGFLELVLERSEAAS